MIQQKYWPGITVVLLFAFIGFSAPHSNIVAPQGTEQPAPRSLQNQSEDFFFSLFDTHHWVAHWDSGRWSPLHGWMQIVSDVIIWLSFLTIPLVVWFGIYRKNRTLPHLPIIVLFGCFLLLCGLSHLVNAAVFWWPAYRLSALIRMLTAIFSVATVIALIRTVPEMRALKGPRLLEKIVTARTKRLREVNERLKEEIATRQAVEQQLINLNKQLEEKSEGLEKLNQELLEHEAEIIRSDEKIKELNLKLEEKVEERTEQLHTINRELEAFTYSVSHDLRAPLRAINGYARILAEEYNEQFDNEARRLVSIIARNAVHMGQLIDDLLQFSQTSRTDLVKTQFDAEREIRQILDEQLMHEPNRVCKKEIKPLEPCMADMKMLRQVWVNLISNALKYSRTKQETYLEIGCKKLDGFIEYFIRDNGVGFDMKYVDKLFGVFQRLHKKEEFEGTGVGLALVKRILQRHGGHIRVEAKPNEGATFYFTLPMK